MRLLRRLLTLIIVLVLIVLTPVFLLYKNGVKPTIDSAGHLDYQQSLRGELDYLVEDANTDKKISLFVSEDALNYTVNNAIEQALGAYSESDDYVSVIEDIVYLQGAWFKITDKSIKLNVGAHVKYKMFTFKTLLLLDVELVEFNLDTIKLKINKLNVGKLPFKFLLKIKTVSNILNNTFNDIGSFNSEDMTVEFHIDTLLGDAIGDDPTLGMLKTIVSDNDIMAVETKVVNEVGGFSIGLNLNPIHYTDGYLVLNSAEKITTEAEFNTFLQQKILAEALSGEISFDERELSALVEYSLNIPSSIFSFNIFL